MSSSLGDQLRAKREELGLSLADIVTQTRIPLSTLTAIEDGRYDDLPAKPFTRGFVRTYAKIVGLNPDSAVSLFELEATPPKEHNEFETPTNPVETEPTSTSKESLFWFQIPRSLVVLFGLLLIGFLSAGIYFALVKINSYDTTPPTSSTPGNNAPQSEIPMPQLPLEASKTTSGPDPLSLTNTPPAATSEPQKVDSSKAESPNSSAKADLATPVVKKEKPPKKASPKTSSTHSVSVHAIAPVTLVVTWTGGTKNSFSLKSNEIKKILFSNPVKLSVTDGSLVKVEFDGVEARVSPTNSKPLELQFP